MESNINLVLRRYFSTFVSEEDTEVVKALNQGASAIYQIERTIAQLAQCEQTGSPPGLTILSVHAQLEAFLETMIEKPQEPDNAS